ncbi:MacB family efflux pump subunit [Campylobacter ureolyticus]|uniref:Pyoverdine export ATP-binding/permease protein PvdT n=1 Tax=Campylobacter ureolyticus TaxID=827 RepID=A0A9Q4KLU4_9BACT|nr:MacB family efflux pump subunit [Campylobacter ureolyticus]MCZ6159830.1 MacB family efflux pump subunit [Campylobacter ureolyticus]MCZ6163161.1 MacB family efflux pump subunit [Campylobacter ureolyticus]MCZ6165012.1 MacB family efflux pump subunit [Campylobacter ureolyticus]MCZ6173744.1 MacB family efflux pump subunit [Campylobacter ureolyticus]MCZ6186311.1 MacB family efflux pump subunit [Campylobacter ureolyticus]
MLKLENINKNFNLGKNKVQVLNDINLEIKKGEFVAIIGQSGSGKSTLMNIIGCLDTQSSGKYYIDDKDISKFSSDEKASLRRKKFGFVFQRYNLISNLTALENVCLPGIYEGLDDRKTKGLNLLDKLDIKEKAYSRPNQLSGGQQQRVSIARALINGGEVILADEPTGALDSKSGIMVMEILSNLHKNGHTIILVTHDKNVANYANRIIEIKDGKIINDETKKNEKFTIQNLDKNKNKSSFGYKFLEALKMAISSIFSHKLRSFLTMLGIIIGIASVICVVALGEGSQEKILSSIRAIGTNTINIYPGKNFGDLRAGKVKSLSVDDSRILGMQNYLDYSTPNTSTSGVITYKNLSLNANLRGGGVNSLAVNGIEIQTGRSFELSDIANSSSVVIIDQNTKNSFFKDEDPLGKNIFFNQKPLKIIGIAKEDENAFGGSDNLRLYAPFSTVINKITGDRHIHSITVKVKDDINAQLAEEAIVSILTQKHEKKDFFTRNSDTIKKTVESTMATMRLLISSIALISLIVGGIGVMNIMLVSVSERTKEIGIRMAIGAKESDILIQFLIEAIILCIIGGIIGLLTAYSFGYLFNSISGNFYMKFSTMPAIIALMSSCLVGTIFGYLPAKNASKLNPIDALLQE